MTLLNNLSSAPEQLSKLPQRKITQVIILLLLCYIAYLFAQITWLGVSESPQNTHLTLQGSVSASSKPQKQIEVKSIQALNLFGAFTQQKEERVEEVIEDAPETRLKLTLTGVVASSDKATAAAVIESSGRQETYSIGENITGTRATLENVFNDRVIIKLSGGFETLMFEGLVFDKNVKPVQPNYKKQAAPGRTKNSLKLSSTQVVDQRDNKSLTKIAKSLTSDLENDPGKITDYLKISRKLKDGKTIGYQLMPAKDPTFFKSAGLKSGDLAIQMNGFDLTEPREAAQALKSLREQREVSLLLDRNGDMTEILFSIDN